MDLIDYRYKKAIKVLNLFGIHPELLEKTLLETEIMLPILCPGRSLKPQSIHYEYVGVFLIIPWQKYSSMR